MIDELTGIDFPLMQSDVLDGYFGDPGSVYERDFMRVCDLRQYQNDFSHVRDWEGDQWSCRIYCCWVMIEPLKRAFGYLVSRGLAGELRTFDGCYNVRKSKNGRFTSMHSWGLAVDLNAGSNGYGEEPTLSEEFVKCFAECGFEWGGLWSTPDGMHFQLPWIRVRSGPLAPIPWGSI